MKKNMTNNVLYPVSGTAALQSEVIPTLVLIEGGNGAQLGSESPVRKSKNARCPRSFVIMASALIFITFAAVLFSFGLSVHEAVASRLEAAPTASVRVLDGESLWSIAEKHGVDGVSTKDVVSWIKAKNGLSVSTLSAGQSLLVPAS